CVEQQDKTGIEGKGAWLMDKGRAQQQRIHELLGFLPQEGIEIVYCPETEPTEDNRAGDGELETVVKTVGIGRDAFVQDGETGVTEGGDGVEGRVEYTLAHRGE